MLLARVRPWTMHRRAEGLDAPDSWCAGHPALVDVGRRYLAGVEVPAETRRGVVIAGVRCRGRPEWQRTAPPELPRTVTETRVVLRRGDAVEIVESSSPFRDLIRFVQRDAGAAEGVVCTAERPPMRGRAARAGPRFGEWRILAYASADSAE